MMATGPSSAAQPIRGWQQGPYFASLPYSSGFLHGGMQRPRQPSYCSESLRGSYPSTQAQETLQFQDELSELMMQDVGCQSRSLSDPFGPDTARTPYQWSGEAQWCGNIVSPSLDDSIMASSSEYALSSLDSTAPSPQEPTSPEARPWQGHPVEPHIRRDSMNDATINSLSGTYGQCGSYIMTSQHLNIMQGGEDQKVNPNHMTGLVGPCQLNTASTLALDVFRPAWSVNSDFDSHENVVDASPQHDADLFFQARPQWSVRAEQDKLIVEGKARNMSYKEIKEQYKIEGAVSTLRGRYRAAVKPKSQRVRKPAWKPKDVSWPD